MFLFYAQDMLLIVFSFSNLITITIIWLIYLVWMEEILCVYTAAWDLVPFFLGEDGI